MNRTISHCTAVAILLLTLGSTSPAQDNARNVVKQQQRFTLSVALEFSKKGRNGFQRAISYLLDVGPNGHATGFLVGDGLVMTAYHVVSGELSSTKKVILGFRPDDQLEVRAFVNGCEAQVIAVDREGDLALLRVCSTKQANRPKFQSTPTKNERLLLIAQPRDGKMISRGSFYGSYMFRGQEYWSVRIDTRDGFSGSPVYNDKGEVVGVFSGYDWSRKLALISPAPRAEKLLAAYFQNSQP
jgi:S1-C subfamily serine protease